MTTPSSTLEPSADRQVDSPNVVSWPSDEQEPGLVLGVRVAKAPGSGSTATTATRIVQVGRRVIPAGPARPSDMAARGQRAFDNLNAT